MTEFGGIDRRIGDRMRDAVAGRAVLAPALALAAHALGPVFRGVVGVLIVIPRERRVGLRAGTAAAAAALAAGGLRQVVGRSRPDGSEEPGFPSRHAAAATAIVATVRRTRPGLGAVLAAAAALGLAGRVTEGRHDPADIMSGVLLGGAVSAAVRRAERVGR